MSEHDERVAVLEWAHQLVPGLDDTPLTGDEEFWFAEGALAGWEHAKAESAAKDAGIERLTELLQRAWEFPDYPSPGEGMGSEPEDWARQASWREEWKALDVEVRAALAGPGAQDQAGGGT